MDLSVDYGNCVQAEFQVRQDHKIITFKKVKDIKMPGECLIAVLRRGDSIIIPRGDTVIEPGDLLVLLSTRARERDLRNWIAELEAKS